MELFHLDQDEVVKSKELEKLINGQFDTGKYFFTTTLLA